MNTIDKMVQELCHNGVEYDSIGNLITQVKEKGKDDRSVTQVYVVSSSQGMVRAEDYRDNAINSEDTSNYTIVRKNMVAYNPSRLNIGSIAVLKYDEPGLVSPMYTVFQINNERISYKYFEYIIKSSSVLYKINSLK